MSLSVQVVKSFHDGNETVQQMAELKEHNVKFTEDFQAFQEQVENLQVDRRRLKIDRTIRKVLSKLMYKFIAAAFSGWKAKVMRKLRIANLRNKVVSCPGATCADILACICTFWNCK